jgi:DNA-binding FadR family transcriptional regulator
VIRWRLDVGDRTEQLLQLSELRRGIEPVAAALAADRASHHHCRILAAAVSDMVVSGREGDLDAYLLADTVFHRALLEASGNEMLRALAGVVEEVLSGRTHHGMMPATPNPEAIALHDEVARAVRLGDAPGAERAMRAIIEEAASALRDESAQ